MKQSNTTQTPVNLSDVKSIDAIISASYETISGKAGEKRDWERMRLLFAPNARLIPSNKLAGVRAPDGQTPEPLNVEQYIARVSDFFDKNGFFETEVARRSEQYDRIAHAFSTYESRHNADDPQPFMRGINSFQLFYDGRRWWILNIFWQQENLEKPIPDRYLAR
jgi:hypothetical protein